MSIMEEDDIDTETLQAQIDMSMAFAEDLVSSWVKPLASSSKPAADAEKELEILLRRPPRLGVGAPLPESSASTLTERDAVRLKHKLEGKKRARPADDEVRRESESEDDVAESRASAIRKKVKIDPFAMPAAKKKNKDNASAKQEVQGLANGIDVNSQAMGNEGTGDGGSAAMDGAQEAKMDVDEEVKMDVDGEAEQNQADPRKKKKRRKNKQGGGSSAPTSVASAGVGTVKPSSETPGVPHARPFSVSPSKPPLLPSTPPSSVLQLLRSSSKSPSKGNPLDIPVLNLAGPPPVPE
ncbi:hypothetical protein BV25DRAFT_1897915, partial [Artomyces pyxidatus]